jgi:hypothetical protein
VSRCHGVIETRVTSIADELIALIALKIPPWGSQTTNLGDLASIFELTFPVKQYLGRFLK